MEALHHANTFFIISSIGFVILFLLIATAIIFFIKLIRRVSSIVEEMRNRASEISKEAETFIGDVRESILFRLFFRPKSRRKSTEKKDNL